jgi:hypothetical protein
MCQLLAASFLTPLRPALPADAALDHPLRHTSYTQIKNTQEIKHETARSIDFNSPLRRWRLCTLSG